MHEFAHGLGFDHELDRADETLGCQLMRRTCDPFNVSNTNSATQNYASCTLTNPDEHAGEGSVISIGCQVSWTDSGKTITSQLNGDTYFRLINPSGVEVARNDDACGLQSEIDYTVPSGGAGTYTLRQGCYSGSSCSGTTAYTITKAIGGQKPGTTYTPPNDLQSITVSTYCHGWTNLSPWDVVGLQRAYGRKPIGSLVSDRNKCLALNNPNYATDPPSQPLNVQDCLDDTSLGVADENQRWYYDSPSGDWHLSTGFPRGSLDVQWANTADGTRVWNYSSNSTSAQTWQFMGVQLRGMGDLCLDVPNGNFVAGSSVQLWQCADANDNINQQWKIFPIQMQNNVASTLLIEPVGGANMGLVLTVNHSLTHTPGDVTLQPWTGALNQTFAFAGDGKLSNQDDGFCLDAQGANPSNGTIVQTYTCRGPDDSLAVAQQFTLHGPIKGLANKCLDVDVTTGPNAGSKAQLWSCNGQPQQDWEYHW